MPRTGVYGDLRRNAEFDLFSCPNDPGIDSSCRFPSAVRIRAGLHREFRDEDHPFKGILETNVFYEILEIRQIVLERQSPGKCCRIPFAIRLAIGICGYGFLSTREIGPEGTSDGKGF